MKVRQRYNRKVCCISPKQKQIYYGATQVLGDVIWCERRARIHAFHIFTVTYTRVSTSHSRAIHHAIANHVISYETLVSLYKKPYVTNLLKAIRLKSGLHTEEFT